MSSGYDEVNEARNMIIGLYQTLMVMFQKDPDLEIRSPSLRPVDEALKIAGSHFPGHPVIASIQDCFSPEAIESGEVPMVADVLPAVTLLKTLLNQKTSDLAPDDDDTRPWYQQ